MRSTVAAAAVQRKRCCVQGCDKRVAARHLFQRLSLTLMRGNAVLMDGGQTRIFQQQKLYQNRQK